MKNDELKRAAALFRDEVVAERYFDAKNAEKVRMALLRIVEDEEVPLLFLLGEPGSGKSQMLATLQRDLQKTGVFVPLLPDPFSSEKELLAWLAGQLGIEREADFLKERVAERLKERKHLIMLDEAQLLSEKMLEYLRILSDTGAFRFLLAMHKKEGEAILSKPHFRSRSHRVVEMEGLEREEALRYVHKTLEEGGCHTAASMMNAAAIKGLYSRSGGNFRWMKRMLQSAFSQMEEARSRGMTALARPCDTIWCMAAIDTGLEDA